MSRHRDDCLHPDSLYGRCTDCGMTWEEQAGDFTSDIEAELDRIDPPPKWVSKQARSFTSDTAYTIESDDEWADVPSFGPGGIEQRKEGTS